MDAVKQRYRMDNDANPPPTVIANIYIGFDSSKLLHKQPKQLDSDTMMYTYKYNIGPIMHNDKIPPMNTNIAQAT